MALHAYIGYMDPASQPTNHPVVYAHPAGASFFSKRAPLDVWSMYLVDVVIFIDFRLPWQLNIKIWSICSNDYASKNRIGILCKKMCFAAPHLFSA